MNGVSDEFILEVFKNLINIYNLNDQISVDKIIAPLCPCIQKWDDEYVVIMLDDRVNKCLDFYSPNLLEVIREALIYSPKDIQEQILNELYQIIDLAKENGISR